MVFITNRTQADVDRLLKLQTKGWSNMTSSEQEEWYGVATRGAYNYTDLNRVETAVAEISDSLELGLVTKTNWGMWDVPTEADMVRYLENISVIKSAVSYQSNAPTLPAHMGGLTYETANNIEKTLVMLYQIVDSVPRCGEIFAGEV
jgi:hypothetical protein